MLVQKPPLGVEPRRFHSWRRMEDLSRAIHEYIEKGVFDADNEYQTVSVWVKELSELLCLSDGVQGVGPEKPMEFTSRNALSPKEVDCKITLEFMALTTQALRQIYYLLYMPDGNPDKPESLMVALIKFEGELRKSIGE